MQTIDKLNNLMNLALPDINAGRQPDIQALAEKVGVDHDTAEDIIRQTIARLDKMQP